MGLSKKLKKMAKSVGKVATSKVGMFAMGAAAGYLGGPAAAATVKKVSAKIKTVRKALFPASTNQQAQSAAPVEGGGSAVYAAPTSYQPSGGGEKSALASLIEALTLGMVKL